MCVFSAFSPPFYQKSRWLLTRKYKGRMVRGLLVEERLNVSNPSNLAYGQAERPLPVRACPPRKADDWFTYYMDASLHRRLLGRYYGIVSGWTRLLPSYDNALLENRRADSRWSGLFSTCNKMHSYTVYETVCVCDTFFYTWKRHVKTRPYRQRIDYCFWKSSI